MTQAQYPMTAPSSARSGQPGPGLALSITLMVVGAVIGFGSAIAVAVPLVGTFTSREYVAPAYLSLHLEHARYTVFERSGSRSGLGVNPGAVTIDPSEVAVRDPDGDPVFVFRPSTTETITRDSTVYTGAVQFDAPTSGNYDIRLTTPTATRVLITRSLSDAVRSVLVWFATGAVGGLLLIAGLVLLIVGITRRSRARRATQMGWGQPGWGQPVYGQPAWGQPGWGQPGPQYPPPAYPPPPSSAPPDDPWAPR